MAKQNFFLSSYFWSLHFDTTTHTRQSLAIFNIEFFSGKFKKKGSESDVATDWKTDLIIGKNFNFENPCLLKIRTSFMDDPLSMEYVSIND